MSNHLPDQKNKRDFLFEAVKIAEGMSPMIPHKDHICALYRAWMAEMTKAQLIRNAVGNLGKMAAEGRLPKREEIPHLINVLIKPQETK